MFILLFLFNYYKLKGHIITECTNLITTQTLGIRVLFEVEFPIYPFLVNH